MAKRREDVGVFELYGIVRSIYQESIDSGFGVGEEKELVATFSTRKKLDEFLNRRLLKHPIPFRGFEPGRVFTAKSDLAEFNDYEIVQVGAVMTIPHDPT